MTLTRYGSSMLLGAAVLLAVRLALAAVDVKTDTTCLTKTELSSRLQTVLLDHASAREVDLLVTVEGKTVGDATPVTLKGITGDGDLLLHREFKLSASDCESGVLARRLRADSNTEHDMTALELED